MGFFAYFFVHSCQTIFTVTYYELIYITLCRIHDLNTFVGLAEGKQVRAGPFSGQKWPKWLKMAIFAYFFVHSCQTTFRVIYYELIYISLCRIHDLNTFVGLADGKQGRAGPFSGQKWPKLAIKNSNFFIFSCHCA